MKTKTYETKTLVFKGLNNKKQKCFSFQTAKGVFDLILIKDKFYTVNREDGKMRYKQFLFTK